MDEIAELAERSAKNARRAAVLAVFALAVALVVLAIDNGIKRGIVEEADRARGLLGEIRSVADGIKTTGQGGNSAGGGVDAGDDLAEPARAPAAAGNHAGHGVGVPGKRAARAAPRPRRDE